MKQGGKAHAVITVFFTLVSVLYLSVIFMLIESARHQGARAQTANITDMGNVSVFGEYEVKLLEEYEVLAVDGAYGTGDFHMDRVKEKLWTYMKRNADGDAAGLSAAYSFDPWQVSVSNCEISGYALLTDSKGEAFYQEVVAYMRDTALMQSTGTLIKMYRSAQEADDKRKTFEEKKETSDTAMDNLEEQEKARKEEIERQKREASATDREGLIVDEDAATATQGQTIQGPQMANPLPVLSRLMRKDILSLVCGSESISEGSVGLFETASTRWGKKKGNLSVEKTYSGLLNNLLFREYLLDHFSNWADPSENSALKYGLEYIICGKKNDRDNLKSTVKRLLLIREGCNYAYAVNDASMNAQASTAAGLIIGWLGIAPLTAVLKHALLLGWSYGESLLDVRTLMDGGKVPLEKRAGEWELQISDLANLESLLKGGRQNRSRGLTYSGYLRVLLNLQLISTQKIRALDLIELELKASAGLSNFRVDYCVVKIQDQTTFSIAALFGKVSALWVGITERASEVTVRGGYSYLPTRGG